MRHTVSALGWLAVVTVAVATVAAQHATDADVVAAVRAAIASGGVAQGERTLVEHRSVSGVTPATIEALSWLARGALTAKQFEKANHYAADAYDLAAPAFKERALGEDPHIRAALEAAIDIRASVMAEQGARSEAVSFLQAELAAHSGGPIVGAIHGALDRVSLEGCPAPRLDTRLHVGPRVPSVADLQGRVVVLFFWAHWCAECKAESPTVGKMIDKYRSQGLAIVAPTQRFGYVEGGRPAAPDKELRYIMQVRDAHYGFLHDEPVPVGDANYKEYGVTTVPMHVVLDRQGIVRLYQPGRMTEAELEAAIKKLL
jgi:thiol-disulfide isomerase/thioredoxin